MIELLVIALVLFFAAGFLILAIPFGIAALRRFFVNLGGRR
jgi:hypothetical protein